MIQSTNELLLIFYHFHMVEINKILTFQNFTESPELFRYLIFS